MYTTAAAFLKAIVDAGITHVFVNWGNDHPAFLEELERQRVANGGKTSLEVMTSPSEFVALTAAHGFAAVTGKPAAVIVHVDVGTQALAGAVHNADRGHAPVLIFSGASPFSAHGELKGSKNEWPMWPQDVPDQAAIVRQYMRFTAQVQSGKAVAKTVLRALQFAKSEPKGPVYLWARREVMEEELDESVLTTAPDPRKWPAIAPRGLTPEVARTIAQAILNAKSPLIVTANAGRNLRAVEELQQLVTDHAIAVYASCPFALNLPYSHPCLIGSSFDGKVPPLATSDVVLVLEADVPWMEPSARELSGDARVFLVATDPLQKTYGYSHIDAEIISEADPETALQQIRASLVELTSQTNDAVKAKRSGDINQRLQKVKALHDQWMQSLAVVEASLAPDGITSTAPHILGSLREVVRAQTSSNGAKVLWLNEGVSKCPDTWDHIKPEIPGSMLMSGGSCLGWGLGAAIGAYLGGEITNKGYELIVSVVGDGDYLFGQPSTVYWMARRYETPFLTIILNNGGWASPRLSMLGIYPSGHGSKVSGRQLTVGFGPEPPDYPQIAAAAGGAWGKRVELASELRDVLTEAVKVVLHEKRCAVVDCKVESI
ncbi:Thiamin diphosphate-binding protein [Obba rivulosa]|uniref:Thiamin diphosphate-binding protein n=1 Tax=Obba rivulosa TaxID=1052685 RepID=A0A8E2AYT7_9APHY|nr:Thiamin diphosphate-binding protein [Obba rivulosa]